MGLTEIIAANLDPAAWYQRTESDGQRGTTNNVRTRTERDEGGYPRKDSPTVPGKLRTTDRIPYDGPY